MVLHPVIEDLSLALEALVISAGSLREMAKSMVCTPLCNPSPVYDHRTNVFDSSLAPPGSGLPPPS